jgi:hypothetical protein
MSQVIPSSVSGARPLRRAVLRVGLLAAPLLSVVPFGAAQAGAVPAGAVSVGAVPAGAVSQGSGALVAPPPVRDEDRADGDHLTVTVHNAGREADGTYEVECHPARGSHPDPDGACAVVERNTRWGREVFAPVPEGSVCTMQYGGPATAHVTGTWNGRPVDAWFDRADGCRIARWDRFVPLLPDLRPARPSS